MALWLVRAGRNGEYEKRFFEDNACYLTWGTITKDINFKDAKNYEGIKNLLEQLFPEEKIKTRVNWASQIAAFVFDIKPGDWVAVPLKHKSAIAIGEVNKSYYHLPAGHESFRHRLDVKWLNTEVPRSVFDQDILYSMGAFMTICRLSRNHIEKRIKAIAESNWNSQDIYQLIGSSENNTTLINQTSNIDNETTLTNIDFEQVTRDQIQKIILARFKGHDLQNLVEAILKAQGFTTIQSAAGADGGIDILASKGVFGFEAPRLCVQVKSGQTAIDRHVLDGLNGVMKKVNATHGLLVSWGGFKRSCDAEEKLQFFHIRLWDANDLVNEMLKVYDQLDPAIKVIIPLRKIWALALSPND